MEIVAKLPNDRYVSMDLAEGTNDWSCAIFFRKSNDGSMIIESAEFASEDTENFIRSIFAKRAH